MSDTTTERNRDDNVPLEKKLDDLYALIDGVEVAMLTTRRADGRLVSRPMQTQERAAGADLWFVTDIEAHKLTELLSDRQVNVAYYRPRTREWVSVSGTATVTRSREAIRALYKPDWKAWFPDEGDVRDGGPDDPRIALIYVDAESVVYMKNDRPAPMVLFEIARAMVTGTPPKTGDLRELGEWELGVAVKRDQRDGESRA